LAWMASLAYALLCHRASPYATFGVFMTQLPTRLLSLGLFASAALTTVSAMSFEPYQVTSPKPDLRKIKANGIEKPVLKFGIIKLTDCVPLVAARELGYFAEEGLSVSIEVQGNWKLILEGTVNGTLDGCHMLCGQPIGASIGYMGQADLVVPVSLDLNGNGITVSNALWAEMQEKEPRLKEPGHAHPISAAPLKAIAQEHAAAGKPLKMGMVFPVSCHNYELRYWLAAGGVSPGFYAGFDDPVGTADADIQLSVTPPPQMPQTMAQGTIDGYCVGEPWNQQAVKQKIGVPVAVDHYIWKYNPEKVLGVTRQFAETNPKTLIAITKAIIRAGIWLDESQVNRKKAVEMLANKAYIGAEPEVLAASMMGTFEFEQGDVREVPEYNVFYKHNATYPFYSHCVWYLTQMRRWGQIPDAKPDSWYKEQAERIYRPDIYRAAFEALAVEGKLPKDAKLPESDYPVVPAEDFIDGIAFDPTKPNEYLTKFAIGKK
jgi:nitrate/nitrite transport system substrate-binding protein